MRRTNRKEMIKIRHYQKYRSIILIIIVLTCLTLNFFTQLSLAQIQWNNIHIYNDINYYQDGEDHDVGQSSQQEIKAHLLDIYQPENCHLCPVIVYIHGGTWVLGDKGGLSYKARAFTAQNYIYISINYRLSPDYPFPAHAWDVARAFFWVKNNIQNYGGDPQNIYLMGHSAGGHLAALVALDEQYLAVHHLVPSDISGIIGLDSAAYHLPSLFAAEPENQYLFSWAFGNNPGDWEEASPLHYIQEGLNIPPFLLLVAGGREISKTVNHTFYQHLYQYNYDVTLLHIDEKDHVSIDYDLGKEDDPVFPTIIDWLHKDRD